MPLETMPSAISRTVFSSILQPNLFHEFQPMGGVRASPFDKARISVRARTRKMAAKRTAAAARILSVADLFMGPSLSPRL